MAKKGNHPARIAVIKEWDVWARKHPEDAKISGGIMFFSYLQRERPDLLLGFKFPGDKWQIIHGWLLHRGKVKD